MNSVLKIQLLRSGVQKIQTLEAKVEQGGLGSVCDIVYNLSVEILKLENTFSLCDDIGLEGCARPREIRLKSSSLQDKLCFIRVVKNIQFWI